MEEPKKKISTEDELTELVRFQLNLEDYKGEFGETEFWNKFKKLLEQLKEESIKEGEERVVPCLFGITIGN